MAIKSCQWVRRRLPLVVGGDRIGSDHRHVDRHLVRCPSCRAHLEALQNSQQVLREFASASEPLDQGPLWPELSVRLHESARPRQATAWGFESRRPWIWPLVGLAAGILVASSIISWDSVGDRQVKQLFDEFAEFDLFANPDEPRLLKPEDLDHFGDPPARRVRPQQRSSPQRNRQTAFDTGLSRPRGSDDSDSIR